MMARGEFAYLVAQEAHNLERLTGLEITHIYLFVYIYIYIYICIIYSYIHTYIHTYPDMEYAVVVWALLWATMVTPVVFKYVLAAYVEEKFKMDHSRSERIGTHMYMYI